MNFTLRFPPRDVEKWATQYATADDDAACSAARSAKQRGFLTKPEFVTLAAWKTPRTRARCQSNSEGFVRSVTETALATGDERLRIEVLTLLSGVQWPTASAILHLCAKESYPILDFRAFWSLSCEVPPAGYDFAVWSDYCAFTRQLASSLGVSMRVLDRALWQYSKEHQPRGF